MSLVRNEQKSYLKKDFGIFDLKKDYTSGEST